MSEQTPVAPADVAAPPRRTYLAWAALAAAVFFLPLGLIAWFFAIRADALLRNGEFGGARRAQRIAMIFIIATVVVGGAVYALTLGGLLALGAFSGSQ